jgi:hypothetical protein
LTDRAHDGNVPEAGHMAITSQAGYNLVAKHPRTGGVLGR